MSPEEPLPTFKYHPDPIGTGSVKASDGQCRACGRTRRLIYTGPAYSTEELHQAICPWCIADGTAAEKFDAKFTDIAWAVPKDVPREVLLEVSRRTPGFSGWQQEHWLYHCSNAAAYLGTVGASGLANHTDALDMLSHEHDEYRWPPEQVAQYLRALHPDHSPTAYLFRCLVCRRHLAYSDFD